MGYKERQSRIEEIKANRLGDSDIAFLIEEIRLERESTESHRLGICRGRERFRNFRKHADERYAAIKEELKESRRAHAERSAGEKNFRAKVKAQLEVEFERSISSIRVQIDAVTAQRDEAYGVLRLLIGAEDGRLTDAQYNAVVDRVVRKARTLLSLQRLREEKAA